MPGVNTLGSTGTLNQRSVTSCATLFGSTARAPSRRRWGRELAPYVVILSEAKDLMPIATSLPC